MTNITATADAEAYSATTFADYSGSGEEFNVTVDGGITTFNTIVIPIIFSIVFVIGTIGNGLVMYIMRLKARTLNITDLYVLNLAIADFIFVAMLPFWTTDLALGRWVFGQAMCKIVSGLTYFHLYASVFFLTAMAVDRFIAVVMYQKCRRTKICASAAVISIWIISACLAAIPVYFRGVEEEGGISLCTWIFRSDKESHATWFVVYVITRSIIGFALPLMIIIIFYSLIIFFLKTRKTSGRITGKCQDRATKMVLVVIAVFLVCWVPNQVSNLVYVAQSMTIIPPPKVASKAHYYVHMFSSCLAWAHSCANPILYAFMREDMRVKLTEILNHNIKRCCGDNDYWVDRDSTTASIKSGQRGVKRKTKKSGRDFVNEATRFTNSFRLSTIHKESIDEEPLSRENSVIRENVLKHEASFYQEQEKEELLDDADEKVSEPITHDEEELYDETTLQSIALMDHNVIKTEVRNSKENQML